MLSRDEMFKHWCIFLGGGILRSNEIPRRRETGMWLKARRASQRRWLPVSEML